MSKTTETKSTTSAVTTAWTERLKDLFGRVKPSVLDPVVSGVTCSLTDEMLTPYVEALAQTLVEADDTGRLESESTISRLKEYIQQLLIFRINYVNGIKLPFPPSDRIWVVPAFINVVLEQIGRIDDSTTGLVLKPVLTSSQSKVVLWDAEQIAKTSRWLRIASDRAKMEYALGLPKKKDGDPEMMTLQVINDEVLGEDAKHSGAHALIAGFLGVKVLENVLCPRVLYDTTNTFKRILARIPEYETKPSS